MRTLSVSIRSLRSGLLLEREKQVPAERYINEPNEFFSRSSSYVSIGYEDFRSYWAKSMYGYILTVHAVKQCYILTNLSST